MTNVFGFNGATTFQPWKYGLVGLIRRHFLDASMGPRLFSRGNVADTRDFSRGSSQLQWGHDFSAVEIYCPGHNPGGDMMLQWGHDFSAVEMRRDLGSVHGLQAASMGPRLFSRGNDTQTAR